MLKSSSGVQDVDETRRAGRSGRRAGVREGEEKRTKESEISVSRAIESAVTCARARCESGVDSGGANEGKNFLSEVCESAGVSLLKSWFIPLLARQKFRKSV